MAPKLNILVAATMLLPLAAGAEAQKAPPPSTPPSSPQSTAPGQTGTTPGQEQTTPGEAKDLTPAVTGQTPSGQTVGKGHAAGSQAPAKVQVTRGATVYDTDGNVVGKILSVDSKGAVLSTGTARVKIPLSGFAQGTKGLAISMTRDQIEAAAKSK